jgi:signal transduction histidine kinase
MKKVLAFTVGLLCAQNDRLPIVIPPFDLQSLECYTAYLPYRVHNLVDLIKKDGLSAAVDEILTDRDLESELFILSIEKPVKMIAYSRQPHFFGKTAQELQRLIFPKASADNTVSVIFDRFISTAHKDCAYVPYEWRKLNTGTVVKQVAYVMSLALDQKEYVVGVTTTVTEVPDALVMSRRVKMMCDRLKGRTIEDFFSLINNDPDPQLYFFVLSQDYPYRWLAHGRNNKFIHRTGAQEQHELFAQCDDPECDLSAVIERLVEIAARGGGFSAYTFHSRKEDPILLRFAYVQPIEYNKKKLFLGTSYTPLGFPDRIRTQLPAAVNTTIELIKTVGLDNTLSVIKKTNTVQLYTFVFDVEPPYRSPAQLVMELETSASEATKYARKQKDFDTNYQQLRAGMVEYAKSGGGFYAYEYRQPKPGAPNKLKTAYIKMIAVDKKEYLIGATYDVL